MLPPACHSAPGESAAADRSPPADASIFYGVPKRAPRCAVLRDVCGIVEIVAGYEWEIVAQREFDITADRPGIRISDFGIVGGR